MGPWFRVEGWAPRFPNMVLFGFFTIFIGLYRALIGCVQSLSLCCKTDVWGVKELGKGFHIFPFPVCGLPKPVLHMQNLRKPVARVGGQVTKLRGSG